MAHRMECTIHEYDWGDPEAIARLTGRRNPHRRPQAELWMGAHPQAPSTIDGVGLDAVIAADPTAWLGPDVASRFGGLPFLFKVLAAARPLSIQAHPSAEQAERGFARENVAGIPLDARERTYRDPHHKPELICALTPFEMLCGFRPVSEIRAELEALGDVGLGELVEILDRQDGSDLLDDEECLRLALGLLLSFDEARAAAIAAALARTGGVYARLQEHFPGDVGVAVALLLNHRVLAPGEAVYLGAGNLHSYLSGVGVELMANSDNVIRGGLTTKHIDRLELRRIVDHRPLEVAIQRPLGRIHAYDSATAEFSLVRARLDADDVIVVSGPAIVLTTDGALAVEGLGGIDRGVPVFVGADEAPLRCRRTVRPGSDAPAEVFVASVGADQVRPDPR